jgi:hypothetical protein
MMRVGAVEALAHPCYRVRRLLELGVNWPAGLTEDALYVPATYRTARPLSPAEVDELVRAWEGGMGVLKLAAQFGVHRHTVWRHLRARGIDTTETLSPEALVEAAELYRAGWSLARIAEKFNISDKTVRARLLEVGVTMRKQRGGRKKQG